MRANGTRRGRTAEESPTITGIAAGGYKSLRAEQAIEVRPLTLLAGANSSGKSSMVQPLLLLKQTLDAAYDPGPLLLSGPNVKFTHAEQMFFNRGAGMPATEITVDVRLNRRQRCTLGFRRDSSVGIGIDHALYGFAAGEIRLEPEMRAGELIPVLRRLGVAIPAGGSGTNFVHGVRRDRCFLTVDYAESAGPQRNLSQDFARAVREIIHVSGHRGNPERSYPVTAVEETFPGVFENYVASLVSHWQTANDQERLQTLDTQLQMLGLTGKLEARLLDDTQFELRVGRLPGAGENGPDDSVNIADAGFGVSQTVPVLVALLAAKPGQTVYLEQPEIHLHPRAQVSMAAILATAARSGVTVIVETHSSLLLRSVQTLVATGNLSPGSVKLHWFTRDASTGETTVSSSNLDAAGAFGDWPEDFDDIALASERAYLDAAERQTLSE